MPAAAPSSVDGELVLTDIGKSSRRRFKVNLVLDLKEKILKGYF